MISSCLIGGNGKLHSKFETICRGVLLLSLGLGSTWPWTWFSDCRWLRSSMLGQTVKDCKCHHVMCLCGTCANYLHPLDASEFSTLSCIWNINWSTFTISRDSITIITHIRPDILRWVHFSGLGTGPSLEPSSTGQLLWAMAALDASKVAWSLIPHLSRISTWVWNH